MGKSTTQLNQFTQHDETMYTTKHHNSMLLHIIKDPINWLGTIGASLMVAVGWIAEYATPILALIAGIGGTLIMILSVLAARKKNRLLDLEIKIKQEEYRRGHGIF